MLGSSLARFFDNRQSVEPIAVVRSVEARDNLRTWYGGALVVDDNILSETNLTAVIYKHQPDVVINCIGIIKQKKDATVHRDAIRINSLLPHIIARVCTNFGAKLIHFSTDCVFSGATGGYKESDLPDAIDLYGRSKLLGEVDYDNHLTIRTSIIGHGVGGNDSLIDWFLRQESLAYGYARACFSGLPTVSVARILLENDFLKNVAGLYHLSAEKIDKYSLLQMVKAKYGKEIEIQKSDELVVDRSLNSDRLRQAIGITICKWEALIEEMHHEYSCYFEGV